MITQWQFDYNLLIMLKTLNELNAKLSVRKMFTYLGKLHITDFLFLSTLLFFENEIELKKL